MQSKLRLKLLALCAIVALSTSVVTGLTMAQDSMGEPVMITAQAAELQGVELHKNTISWGSNEVGEKLKATLDNNGTLTISGRGQMKNWESNSAPWHNSFYREKIRKVIIKLGVKNISDYAFYNCHSLKSITIPNSVESIGYGAFYNCSSLENVTIPNSVKKMDAFVFNNCTSLEKIKFSKKISKIGDSAFSNCAVKELILPEGLTKIGAKAFFGCNYMSSIVIPNSVTQIGKDAFDSCKSLKTVYFGGVTVFEWDIIDKAEAGADFDLATIYYYSKGRPTSNIEFCWHWNIFKTEVKLWDVVGQVKDWAGQVFERVSLSFENLRDFLAKNMSTIYKVGGYVLYAVVIILSIFNQNSPPSE